MEFKGTSGNWIVSQENKSLIECDGNIIAMMVGENQVENAKIMAAASDLLEALQLLRIELSEYLDSDGPYFAFVDNAINKALNT